MIITEEIKKNLPLITEEELKEIKLPTEKLIELAINDFDEQLKIDEENGFSDNYTTNSTEEQKINEMKEWSASEWLHYYRPNGTMTLEEFRQKLYKKVDEKILEKYGSDYIN